MYVRGATQLEIHAIEVVRCICEFFVDNHKVMFNDGLYSIGNLLTCCYASGVCIKFGSGIYDEFIYTFSIFKYFALSVNTSCYQRYRIICNIVLSSNCADVNTICHMP